MAVQTEKFVQGTLQTLFSTEAALADDAFSALSANVGTTEHGDYVSAMFELQCQYTTAPDADRRIDLYRVKSLDAGVSYEDESDATYNNFQQLVGWFVPDAVTTAQRLALNKLVPIIKDQKFMLLNNATGQTINANWTLRYLPVTRIFDSP